jgi:hypothetical protein
VPQRSGSALVIVPLQNFNVHAPQYTPPVTIAAAITLNSGSQLGILNAWDIDGDGVTYQLDPSNSASILNTISVEPSGVVKLKDSLTNFDKSFMFSVLLRDDGSSCAGTGEIRNLQSKMNVTLIIIEVNMHSPQFVPNRNGENFCELKFQAYENSFFKIEIVAQDDDQRGDNGNITLLAPEINDRSPQNSFSLVQQPQSNRKVAGIVSNLEMFDYESPKYGSNTMNIMFLAEDHGVTRRRGYCFMTIEILDVNDNVPVFAQRTYTIYIHDQYKTRQFNYRFVAIDKDSGLNGQVQYFMVNDNSIANNLFNLALDGTLTIKNNSYMDMVHDTMQFSIYAQDMSPTQNKSEIVTVRVVKSVLKLLPPFFSDFPDPPEIRDISEMTVRGSLLKNFSIVIQTNPADQFLRCLLSPKPNPEWFKFEFLNLNQQLSRSESCYLKIEDPLNYRVASSMVVYMVAEVGNYQMTSTARELKILTIHLKEENINPPKFVTNTIEASVVEGTEDLNKIIAVVKAYDLDKTYPFNAVTYEFDANTNADGFFSINSTTGEIKLMQRIHNKKNIPLEVIAKDGANAYNSNMPNRNSIYVDVKVIDINDNPPVFGQQSYAFDVNEDARPGFVIGRIEVSDEDTESFFNFSISDSTFGIRGIYDSTKSKSHYNYKGSAEIYLNNYLDFNKKNAYSLQIYVSDSQFLSKADLVISVKNVNDRAPVFLNTPYVVYIDEINVPISPIATLSASDDDNIPNDFVFECYSTPSLDKNWFELNPKTGVLKLVKGLDRDLPNGMPVYYLPVSVTDLGSNATVALKSYTTVKIVLNDINDNAPFVTYGTNKPLIINEEDNAGSVELYVVDVDTPKYGPPFSFILDNYTDLFGLGMINCVNCNDRAKYQLFVKKALLREQQQKHYVIPYTVSDNGGLSRTGNLLLTVGDIDNSPQSDGSKQIRMLSYQNSIGSNLFLGTLYVKDRDDWDLITKRASNCITTPAEFDVRAGLQIYGPKSFATFPKNVMNMQCQVTDSAQTTKTARVDFSLDNVDYSDVIDLAGLRLFGIAPESLIKKVELADSSVLDELQRKLMSIIGLSMLDSSNTLKIVTIRGFSSSTDNLIPNQIPSYDVNTFGSDVYFFVRKSKKLVSSRQVYNLLFQNLNQLDSPAYSGSSFLFDLCSGKSSDFCPASSFCKQAYITSRDSLTVDGNATALVGMDTIINPECYCSLENAQAMCYNGGTVVNSSGGSDYYCSCPDGFDGPRCETLSLTFSFSPSSPSHSFALFRAFELCDPMRVEFEFSTERSKGLLLFNGPINRDSVYFIAVEIFNKTLLVHIGYTNVSFPSVVVSDKVWHKVDILMSLNSVQVILDKCNAQTVKIDNYEKMSADKLKTDDVRLSLGGIPPAISINHYYYSVLNVFEYEGCIRNLRVNGGLRDIRLSNNQNEFNLAQNNQQCDCLYNGVCDAFNANSIVKSNEFPWWIILIVVGTLLMLGKLKFEVFYFFYLGFRDENDVSGRLFLCFCLSCYFGDNFGCST